MAVSPSYPPPSRPAHLGAIINWSAHYLNAPAAILIWCGRRSRMTRRWWLPSWWWWWPWRRQRRCRWLRWRRPCAWSWGRLYLSKTILSNHQIPAVMLRFGDHRHWPLPVWDHSGGSRRPRGCNPVSRQVRKASRWPPAGKWMAGLWTPSWPTRTIPPPASVPSIRLKIKKLDELLPSTVRSDHQDDKWFNLIEGFLIGAFRMEPIRWNAVRSGRPERRQSIGVE